MKTDLTREQMMMIVERARHQRSLAAGDLIAAHTHRAIAWLARAGRKLLGATALAPTARHQ